MGQCNKSSVKKSQHHADNSNNNNAQDQELLTEEERIKNSLNQLFPNFKPIQEGDKEWATEKPTTCPECSKDFDFLTFYNHCRNCGQILCSRCCYSREAMKGEKICGICMGHAMTVFRKRELSQIETRMRRNSELRRTSELQQQQQQQHRFAGAEEEAGAAEGVKEAPAAHPEGATAKRDDEGAYETVPVTKEEASNQEEE